MGRQKERERTLNASNWSEDKNCRVKLKDDEDRETDREVCFSFPQLSAKNKAEQSRAQQAFNLSAFQQTASQWNIDASIPTKKCLNDFGTSEWGNSPIYNWYGWNVNNWMGKHRNRDITGEGVSVCACVCVCSCIFLPSCLCHWVCTCGPLRW